jgi:hypothetical protein
MTFLHPRRLPMYEKAADSNRGLIYVLQRWP